HATVSEHELHTRRVPTAKNERLFVQSQRHGVPLTGVPERTAVAAVVNAAVPVLLAETAHRHMFFADEDRVAEAVLHIREIQRQAAVDEATVRRERLPPVIVSAASKTARIVAQSPGIMLCRWNPIVRHIAADA